MQWISPYKAILALFTIFITVAQPALAADFRFQTVFVPNDPFVKNQSYLKQILAENAWPYTIGSREVVVAVLDTGVDINHPDLSPNIWSNLDEIPGNNVDDDHNGYIDDTSGWDFATNSNDPMPKLTDDANPGGMNHGTIVAGIIGAVGNNGIGVAGMNWNVRIMPLRVINGSGVGYTNKIGEAIRYAVDNGANIINLSFTSDTPSSTIQAAVWDAYQRGVLIVTAAGNSIFDGGQDLDAKPIYPACVKSPLGGNPIVLTVAAVNQYDQKSDFSNYGKNCVQISAPGEGIFGTLFSSRRFNDYSEEYGGGWSGTSVSSPMVAGTAALLKALAPQASAYDLIKILTETADPIDGLNPTYQGKIGKGRLNVQNAVERLLKAPPKVFVKSPRIVVARGSGNGVSTIQVFNEQGLFINSLVPFPRLAAGLNVAVGDIDGDGNDEIVVAPAGGGGPHVRIFNMSGTMVGEFFAYDKLFTGGVALAVADVDHDGSADIITAPGIGGGPHIRIWSGSGKEKNSFMAFDTRFRGGISLATADLNGDGAYEIVVGQMTKGKDARAFNKDGALIAVFTKQTWVGDGVSVGAVDIEGDGKDEVVVGQRTGGSVVKIYSGLGVEVKSWTLLVNGRTVANMKLGTSSPSSGKRKFIPISLPGKREALFYSYDGILAAEYQVFTLAPLGASQIVIGSVNAEQ